MILREKNKSKIKYRILLFEILFPIIIKNSSNIYDEAYNWHFD